MAHQGFNILAWQEALGPYQWTVLEDFHLAQAGEGKAKLVVQISHKTQALPKDTQALAKLSVAGEIIYQGDLEFISNSSNDGKSFYSIYALNTGIKEQGIYELSLTITGPLGKNSKEFLIRSQQGSQIWLLEFLPSIIILLVSTFGLTILFLPHRVVKIKD